MKGKGFLDFSSITERNKENSFLDVDWIIKQLLTHGSNLLANNDAAGSEGKQLRPSQSEEKVRTSPVSIAAAIASPFMASSNNNKSISAPTWANTSPNGTPLNPTSSSGSAKGKSSSKLKKSVSPKKSWPSRPPLCGREVFIDGTFFYTNKGKAYFRKKAY